MMVVLTHKAVWWKACSTIWCARFLINIGDIKIFACAVYFNSP